MGKGFGKGRKLRVPQQISPEDQLAKLEARERGLQLQMQALRQEMRSVEETKNSPSKRSQLGSAAKRVKDRHQKNKGARFVDEEMY